MERARERMPAYEEPFVWWGPVWELPPERTLIDLVRDGVLGVSVAALLWGLLARRASIIVAAGPSGAGKTTVLTALLDCLPPGTRRIYVRGCYETFAFLDDPAVDPERTALLVNEISAHLPSYLWGPGVRRILDATRRGFSLVATAHASSVADLVGQLAGYPLRVPVPELGGISIVVLVTSTRVGERVERRVAEVWGLGGGGGGGLTVALLADLHDISHQASQYLATTPDFNSLSQLELDARGRYLASLIATSTPLSRDDVRRAITGFNGTEKRIEPH